MFSSQEINFLSEENIEFSGTGGVSEANAHYDFIPAFLEADSGQVQISCFQDGRQAPCHLLDGLPETWITQRDLNGRVVKVKSTVVSGFVRLGRFFTRQEAADYMEILPVEAV